MTYETSIKYLRKFFPNPSDVPVSLDQIFKVFELEPNDIEKNKMWLGNKTTPMKRFHLIAPVYEGNKLVALKLTNTGKDALTKDNDMENKPIQVQRTDNANLGNILSQISKLKLDYPDFKITFSITPKED